MKRPALSIRVLGRLYPGVTVEQARSEMESIARQLRSEFKEASETGFNLDVVPLRQDAVRELRPALLALFGAVGLVLMMACANVANLLLARAGSRQKEFALRGALGATRGRIIRQLVSENILLSLLGGALGLLLGWWGLKLLLILRPSRLARLETVDFSFTMLGFTFAVSFVAAMLFGLAPVLESARVKKPEAVIDEMLAHSRSPTARTKAALLRAVFDELSKLTLLRLGEFGRATRRFLPDRTRYPGLPLPGS